VTWVSLNPNSLLPTGFTAAVSSMSHTLNSALSSLASLTIPPLPSTGGVNPTAAVAQALLNVVEGLLQAGRIHVLAIPITKTFPNPPAPALPPTLDDLQAELDTTLGPAQTANAAAYANMLLQHGGNAGFFNAFSASLFDVADANRPQYGSDDAVVMAVVLAGAPSFAQINAVAQTLDYLIAPKSGASLTARTVPVPQNLTAKVAGASVSPGVGIMLGWTPPQPNSVGSPYFPGVTFSVNRYAVIRSTDAKMQTATSVNDLFQTSPITQGLTEGANTVVSIGSGNSSSYLDTSVTLSASAPYYYAIAWEVTSVESGTKTTLTFDKLSNVCKVVPTSPQPQQTGTAPDWQATPSALGSIPPLSRAIEQLVAEAQVLIAPSPGPADKLTAAIQIAQGAAQRIASRSTELVSDVTRLSNQLGRPLPSLYSTIISSINGGNAYLVSELANQLNNTSDPNTPPFNNGEYVCGVCLVAGAPRLADLAAIIAFFEALFGSSSSPNPLMTVLNAIDTVVTQAETTVFGQNMQPVPAGTNTSNIDPTTGLPIITPSQVFSASGAPVAGDSPDNPNAGDTNELSTSDLC